MVQNKWFEEERKASLIQRQKEADAEGVPLSLELTIGGPPAKYHNSVYEPKVSYSSRLQRTIIAYDSKKIVGIVLVSNQISHANMKP